MKQDAYITCRPRPDGPGALAHAQASVMLYARQRGFTYLTPADAMVGHNDEHKP